MVTLGNILLGIAALVYLIFLAETFGKPAPRGDAGVGFAFALILTHLVFLVVFAIVAGIIHAQGGFAWVSESGMKRFLWIAGGLMLTVFGSIMLNAKEGPVMRGMLGQLAGILIPALALAGLAVLLNRPSPVSLGLRLPLLLAAALGALVCSPFIFMSLKTRVEHTVMRIGRFSGDSSWALEQIERCDVSKDVSELLLFSDKNHPEKVRKAALEKIKSLPDWQQQIAEGMHKNFPSAAFTFLASNDVEEKALFDSPIHDGIQSMAGRISDKIAFAYQDHHLHDGQFCPDTERILQTLKKFEGNGEDYKPDVQALRDAFDTPTKVKRPTFYCLKELDAWLKAH